MASEASVADQAVAEIVTDVSESTSTAVEATLPKHEDLKGEEEEEKILATVSHDVSNSAETTLASMEDLKGKNEEKIEADVVHDISSADETGLLKPKDREKDEEETVKVESSTAEEPATEPEGIPEQKENATVTEVVKEVIVENTVSEPSVELMDKADASTTPVEPPAEAPEVSVAEDSVETSKEPTLAETATEQAKDAEPSEVADDKAIEPNSESSVPEPDPTATVTLDSDGTVDKPQIGESTSDVIEVTPELSKEEIPQNETSDSVTVYPTVKVLGTVELGSSQATDVPHSVDEPKEVQIETVVPKIPAEKKDNDHNAGDPGTNESAEVESFSEPVVAAVSDTTLVTEVAESPVELEVNVENEKQENTFDVENNTTETEKTIVENEVAAVPEEVKASDVVTGIDQIKNESKEGEVLTQDRDFVGAENDNSSPKDLDAEQKPAIKETLLDKLASETSADKKQDPEQTSVDTAKESEDTKVDAEAPRSEVPSKKSQGAGNNLLSKVKKSIVKVKKAIIGKSPNSKTMAPERNSDAYAK